jgi:hypothetical protein
MKVVNGLLSSDNEACQKLEFESILLKILAHAHLEAVLQKLKETGITLNAENSRETK